MKKMKIIIIVLVIALISISTAYAVTIIKASDVIYDTAKSGGSSSNVQGAIDELYSMAEKGGNGSNNVKLINENIITYVTDLAKTDTTNLAYDDTVDKNLRYIGADPNNYVEFNGELWRIIGVMNNVKDSDGKSASRVKIIRDESISATWDNKPSGTGSSISNGGSNDWTDSRLMQLLNSGPYWNRTSGICYFGFNNATRSCDYSSNGLTNEAKLMISKVMWNIGGNSTSSISAKAMYVKERGTEVYTGRKTTWIGNVGLIYPSDYGYAVGGAVRKVCLNASLSSYNENDCYANDWLNLKRSNTYQFTISPISNDGNLVFAISSKGVLQETSAHSGIPTFPSMFIDTKLYITKGEGTKDNPYKISFEKETSTDTSNASPPKLDSEGKLIPVTLADDGKVTMVSKNDSDWYNYSEKRWANVVILNDSPSQTYKVGDTIKEEDIESYFVWIPKYKYRLWNTGTASKKAHEIDIVFDTKDTTDVEGKSCKTPMTSGSTGNCNNGEYMTHPAFISLGVNGFWVGKFETGYRGATTIANAKVNSSASSKIVIKPNAYSWLTNTVYNSFVSSYNYERSLDSHMMKNTEWGAVAYLSHSKYGINNEVNINNNSSYKTGFSASPSLDQHTYPGTSGDGSAFNQAYNTEIGYLASTTGNITGIYDMSGGAHEYLSSHISGNLGSSGFTTSTIANYNAKYFDVYNASSVDNSYQYRILGDATGELGAFTDYEDSDGTKRPHSIWYNSYALFLESGHPWTSRGGTYSYGVLAGQLSFNRNTGGSISNFGFRIVLVG